jgi:3-deoxy-7-phosphoheptulonate synthase
MSLHDDRSPASWHDDSWRGCAVAQHPVYEGEDAARLRSVEQRLRSFPGLVSHSRADALRTLLANIADSPEGFVIQGGECAESFADFSEQSIDGHIDLLHDFARILATVRPGPMACIGRMAGQFAKPRSEDRESVGNRSIPVYRGDLINDKCPEAALRRPDPARLETGYFQAAAVLNHLSNRLNVPSPHLDSDRVARAIFTSHEALHLHYEQALLRRSPSGAVHASSADFLWIGKRTLQLDGAHVEFMRGIGNPIGIKVDADVSADTLLRLVDMLNPANVAGRLTLISRMGLERSERLYRLANALSAQGRREFWICDPMHGNTIRTPSGRKTRRLSDMMLEYAEFADVMSALGSKPKGVHVEMTPDDVVECIHDGAADDYALSRAYRTACDPRLNANQARHFASLIARCIDDSTNRNVPRAPKADDTRQPGRGDIARLINAH